MSWAEARQSYLKKFDQVYQSLNADQRRAVDAIEGPVLVVAGPGTGKTQVLTVRIANILLKTDTPSRAILALTFTESGVKAMRERLIGLIGPEAYQVNVHTFHSFCSAIIKDNPDRFVLGQELEPLSELERVQIFRSILDEGDFEILRPAGSRYYYVRSLIKNIQDLKREGINPNDFGQILVGAAVSEESGFTAKDREKNVELLEAYQRYQESLRQRSRYDFEDMINFVVAAFESDEEFLRQYQERFQYLLLDEFQDTNSLQNRVVRLLASFWGEAANVFAVGDDEQSIYRFQGASLENILYFEKLYPQATVISLRENYRSRQPILDAAFELIQNNRVRLDRFIKGVERRLVAKDSLAESREKPGIEVGRFSSGTSESFFVGAKIKELVEVGTQPVRIAVIYRNNSDAVEVADMLSRLDLRYDLQAGEDILKDHHLVKLLRLLEAILHLRSKGEDLDLFTLFNYEFLVRRFGFSYLDTLKLARFASDLKVNFLEAINHRDFRQSQIVSNPQPFLDFVAQLVEWQKVSTNSTFTAFFESVVNQSGFLDWLLTLADGPLRLSRLNSLFAEVKRLNGQDHRLGLDSFLADLEILREAKIPIREEELNLQRETVVLTTAHGAKGLEFDYVFLIKAIDGKFGNNKIRELIKLPPNMLPFFEKTAVVDAAAVDEANEDERRLFYVALTRARQGVFVTFADVYVSDQYRQESVPSLFLTEIKGKYKNNFDVHPYEKRLQGCLSQILKPLSPEETPVAEKDFLKTVLTDFRLSVTALNTYLECPYKFKLNNLLRTPRAKDKSLAFGSAIHLALELLLREYKESGRLPPAQFLVDRFESALQKEILTEPDLLELSKRGRRVLKAYYDFYKTLFVRPIFTEKFFGYGFAKIYLGDIPLTGKIDRIDPLGQEDGGRSAVKVVDYKTGRVRSRNEIEGRTKKQDSNYKRQLVFYKLLADLDPTFNYEVLEAELDFVEGREGKFTRHAFVINQEEMNELKRVIRQVMSQIRALEFPRTTNYDSCTYCEFKSHCWPEGIPAKTEDQLGLFDEVGE